MFICLCVYLFICLVTYYMYTHIRIYGGQLMSPDSAPDASDLALRPSLPNPRSRFGTWLASMFLLGSLRGKRSQAMLDVVAATCACASVVSMSSLLIFQAWSSYARQLRRFPSLTFPSTQICSTVTPTCGKPSGPP